MLHSALPPALLPASLLSFRSLLPKNSPSNITNCDSWMYMMHSDKHPSTCWEDPLRWLHSCSAESIQIWHEILPWCLWELLSCAACSWCSLARTLSLVLQDGMHASGLKLWCCCLSLPFLEGCSFCSMPLDTHCMILGISIMKPTWLPLVVSSQAIRCALIARHRSSLRLYLACARRCSYQ